MQALNVLPKSKELTKALDSDNWVQIKYVLDFGRKLPIESKFCMMQEAHERAELAKATDALKKNKMIGFQPTTPKLSPRYVLLQSQDLFNRLVEIYTPQFMLYIVPNEYDDDDKEFEFYNLPDDRTDKFKAAAEAYVSCWFWDLYISIKRSIFKSTYVIYDEHYQHEPCRSLQRYDPFLQYLNTAIRPTHVCSVDDILWIPLIREDINWEDDNPFHLDGWLRRDDQICSLIPDMNFSKPNTWQTVPLDYDGLGNPMWLLDWSGKQAYCWFPKEGHLTDEDLVAAYALGIPCTPNLGPRDFDDWQTFPGNAMPINIIWSDLVRVTDRRFHGSAEFRTYDTRTHSLPANVTPSKAIPPLAPQRKKARKGDMEDGTSQIEISRDHVEETEHKKETDQPNNIKLVQYRVTDWCYHARVIIRVSKAMQHMAWRSFFCSK